MRLGDESRKCVVYLGWPHPDGDELIDPEGTGFLVQTENPRGRYLVTAAHVAKRMEDAPFGIRLNTKNGSGRVDRLDQARWFFHPDPTADVAVLEYDAPDWADCTWFSTRWFLSPEKLDEKDVGAGDLVYVVGVFQHLHGQRRNMPFVHTGHIALMAGDEPIPLRDWNAADPRNASAISANGYLVEAAALPGASGSPVFVRRTLPMLLQSDDGPPLKAWVHGTIWLLGLWHGSWLDDLRQHGLLPAAGPIRLNVGVVIPAAKIMEAIDQARSTTSRAGAAQSRTAGAASGLADTDPGPDQTMDDLLKKPPGSNRRED